MKLIKIFWYFMFKPMPLIIFKNIHINKKRIHKRDVFSNTFSSKNGKKT